MDNLMGKLQLFYKMEQYNRNFIGEVYQFDVLILKLISIVYKLYGK